MTLEEPTYPISAIAGRFDKIPYMHKIGQHPDQVINMASIEFEGMNMLGSFSLEDNLLDDITLEILRQNINALLDGKNNTLFFGKNLEDVSFETVI